MNNEKQSEKQEQNCSTCRHFKLDEELTGQCENARQIYDVVKEDWYCIWHEVKPEQL